LSLIGINGGKTDNTAPTVPNFTYNFRLVDGTEKQVDGYLVIAGSIIAISQGEDGNVQYVAPIENILDVAIV
jgi:hypothetical protein